MNAAEPFTIRIWINGRSVIEEITETTDDIQSAESAFDKQIRLTPQHAVLLCKEAEVIRKYPDDLQIVRGIRS